MPEDKDQCIECGKWVDYVDEFTQLCEQCNNEFNNQATYE